MRLVLGWEGWVGKGGFGEKNDVFFSAQPKKGRAPCFILCVRGVGLKYGWVHSDGVFVQLFFLEMLVMFLCGGTKPRLVSF